MARVHFTPNLERHVECAVREAAGATLREVLDRAFDRNPRLRGYVLDDHGGLRRHMVVFVDGLAARDRRGLSDPVAADAEVFVMQGLSGG